MNFMSKIVSCILATVMCVQYIAGIVVFADDSAEWTYTDYGDGIAVTGYKGSDDDVFVPAEIDAKKVVKIGDDAFRNNTAINSVTLSSNITAIGSSAFEGASNMVCIVTNDALTEIGDSAFKNCAKFNSVILKDNVTSIGNNAFSLCPILRIYCNENNTAYRYAKANGVKSVLLDPEAQPERVIQDGISYYITNGEAILMAAAERSGEVVVPAVVRGYPVTRINSGAFSEGYGKNITSVILPDTVRDIGDNAFEGSEIEEIIIPDSVETVGWYVFSGCNNLKKATISKNIKIMEYQMFAGASSLEEVVIPDGVTEIAYGAFYDCKNLKAVDLPNTLTSIGQHAFFQCESIEEIYLPDSVTTLVYDAFSDCHSLTKVRLSHGLTKLDEAFSYCESLREITIPDSVTTLKTLFSDCRGLKTLTIPKSVTEIDSRDIRTCNSILYVYSGSYMEQYAKEHDFLYTVIDGEGGVEVSKQDGITYYVKDNEAVLFDCEYDKSGSVIIPQTVGGYNVTAIADYAFVDCRKITDVKLPDTIKTIGRLAFSLDISLENVNLPRGITSIGEYAFRDTAIKAVTIPSGVTELGADIFTGCEQLESVTLPNNMTAISAGMFSDCSALKSITLPTSLQTIESRAFAHSGLEEIIIPINVSEVGENAFEWCQSLRSAVWSPAANEIKQNTFTTCTALSSVTLYENVKTIEEGAFDECVSLETILVPNSVKSIADNAFCFITTLNVYKNSIALNYAILNNLPYYVVDSGAESTKIYDDGVFKYIIENGEASVARCLQDVIVINDGWLADPDNAITWIYDPTVKSRVKDLELTIPSQIEGYPVTSIRNKAFYHSRAIKSLTLPDTITEIGDNAFYRCGIENINMPSKLKSIGNSAFCYCSLLKGIHMPQGLEKIGDSAFLYCTSLTEAVLPSSLSEVGNSVFEHCENIKKAAISNGLRYIPSDIFGWCTALEEVEVPETVEVIESGAFEGCALLKSVNIPSHVREIGPYAFWCCTSLESINIPDSLTQLEPWSIGYNPLLKNLFISDKVTLIYFDVFTNCPNLIICTYQDSAAHVYAEENNIPYFIIPPSENPYKANGRSVSGTVTTVLGSAVEGATVEFTDKYGNVREQVRTNEYGEYSFGYAEVGKYTIRAMFEGANSGTDSFGVRRKNVFDTLLVGNTDITIQDAVTIQGTVTDKDGNLIKAANVSLIDEEGMIVAEYVTDSKGEYIIANIPNGTYTVRAQKSGSAASEQITAYAPNGDIECDIEISRGGSVTGNVTDENGAAVVWAEIIVTDMHGNRVTSLYTDNDGKYSIEAIPFGSYSITAILEDSGIRLEGAAAVSVNSVRKVTAETIVVKKKDMSDETITIYGRAANSLGEGQTATVVIRDIFMNEIAACQTGENGKYKFMDIPDGTYAIIAQTESNGAGYSTVVVKDGYIVLGSPGVLVYKTREALELEETISDLPSADDDYQTVRVAKTQIMQARSIYNGLSYIEKKSISAALLQKLNAITEIVAPNVTFKESGKQELNFKISGLENIISDDEIENEEQAEIAIDISLGTEIQLMSVNDEEDTSAAEFLQERANQEDKTIIDYLDIDLTKSADGTEKDIKNITKDSVGTGKVQITLTIPEEYRGHENYSMLHMHNGEIATLVDIDDNPDTITFETDKFSQYALAYDDNVRASANNLEASVSYDNDTKTVNVISDQNIKGAKVIFAAYLEGRLVSLQVKEVDFVEGVNEPVIADDFDTSNSDSVKVMIWRDFNSMMPLFDY